MQGLPTQLLSRKAPGPALVDKPVSSKNEMGQAVSVEGKKESKKESKTDFSSLFESVSAPEQNAEISSEVKTEKGEALKNLLISKGAGQNAEEEEVVAEVVVTPKQAEALLAALMANSAASKSFDIDPKLVSVPQNTEDGIEQKISKTGSNLDQLLNSLKGTQDNVEVNEEGNVQLQNIRSGKDERPVKGQLKSESPLEFLMNGTKSKDVTENVETKSSDIEALLSQKKVVTGEDYLKNVESTEKKGSGKLALLNGLELPKNPNQNVKAYGQGLSLLSDPLIRNTKDLAFKDGIKGKNASVDEVRSPDMKAGAELAAIKQEIIPMMNGKENHGQQAESQTQANQKVLDLGKLNTSNTNEIIKRISDYVEQNQVANKSSLDLTVRHDSLGEFKIQVNKMPAQSLNQANQIDMQITTSSKEGHDFFMKNEISLMKNLNNAGINLSDLRIVSSMGESSSSGTFGQSDSKNGSDQNANSKQFMSSGSFSSEFSNGKERRKELWEEYQQRYGA
ncbi:MAG: hypothetical protein WC635_16755 [Bacteriovorax sp.]|jgi:hypothetical protein